MFTDAFLLVYVWSYAYFQSMTYTSFDKDTATPKEKGSPMFPDPILELWGGTCQSEIMSCN